MILDDFDENIDENLMYTLFNIADQDNKFVLINSLMPINELNNNTYQLGLCNKGGVVYSNQLIIKEDHQFKIIN